MAQVQPATASPAEAFTAAVSARNLDAVAALLAPDVVLHSPIVRTPFRGREVVVDLYAALFEAFEELEVVEELDDPDSHTFFWKGRMGGRDLEGLDRVAVDDEGRVADITIMARPLVGLAAFLTHMGFAFARRRRGPVAARLLRLSARPLPALFTLLDPVVRWLQRGRTGAQG